MRSNEIESYKWKLKLSNLQREILIGILLGDATLETQNEGRTFRLKCEQSLSHKEYLGHLYDVFRNFVLSPPRIRRIKIRDRNYKNLAFSTLSHPVFRFYAHQFYCGGRKVAPKQIKRWLTPRNIAYWYMDDGSLKSRESKGVILNTQGFSNKDVDCLCNALKEKFALQASPRRQKEGLQIYVSGRNFEMIRDLIKPYIHDSMIYKFPDDRLT